MITAFAVAVVAAVLGSALTRHNARLAMILTPLILGLLVTTVYRRFHYALDTAAGVGLAR